MQKPAPSPTPTKPMARRLEHVRTSEAGGIPLAEFHRRLCEGWPADLGRPASYEAARTYHYNRDAPAAYLARVAATFGVRLQWLATGEGAPTEAEVRRKEERDQESRDLGARAAAEHRDEWLRTLDDARYSSHQRAAVLRFSRLLDDIETTLTPWHAADEHIRVLRDALEFLERADTALNEVVDPKRKGLSVAQAVLGPPSGDLRRAALWYDALLAAFAQRVAGLGLPVDSVPKMTEVVEARVEAPKPKRRASRTPSKKRTSIARRVEDAP